MLTVISSGVAFQLADLFVHILLSISYTYKIVWEYSRFASNYDPHDLAMLNNLT